MCHQQATSDLLNGKQKLLTHHTEKVETHREMKKTRYDQERLADGLRVPGKISLGNS